LSSVKENLDKKKTPEKSNSPENFAGFQFWHIVLVALISLIIGAFFSA